MSVTFEEDQKSVRTQIAAAPILSPRGIEGLFAKVLGLKDVRHTRAVLLVLVGVCITGSAVMLAVSTRTPGLTPEEIKADAWMQAGNIGAPPTEFITPTQSL